MATVQGNNIGGYPFSIPGSSVYAETQPTELSLAIGKFGNKIDKFALKYLKQYQLIQNGAPSQTVVAELQAKQQKSTRRKKKCLIDFSKSLQTMILRRLSLEKN
jgi:hypothetical protein